MLLVLAVIREKVMPYLADVLILIGGYLLPLLIAYPYRADVIGSAAYEVQVEPVGGGTRLAREYGIFKLGIASGTDS